MSGVTSTLTGAVSSVVGGVSSAVKSVGNAVKDVGSFVDDEILQPVVKAVDKTIDAALEDPVNTAIRVGAFAVGGPAGLAIANGTIALAQGQDIGTAAMMAGKTYVVGQAGAAAGQYAGSAATTAGYGTYAANAAQGATQGATSSALSGGDAQTGALMGGLGGVNKSIAQSASDQQFEDWARGEASKSYDNAPSPTEQDVLAADPSIKMDFPLETPADQTVPGYFNEITGEYVPAEQGQYSSPLDSTSGTNYDSISDTGLGGGSGQAVSGSDLLEPPSDYTPSAYNPLLTTNQMAKGLGFLENALLNPAGSGGGGGQRPTGLGGTTQQKPQSERYASPDLMAGNNLTGDTLSDEYELARLRQLYGSIAPTTTVETPSNMAHVAPVQNPVSFNSQGPLTMATGGSTSSTTTENPFPIAQTGITKGPIMGGGQRKVLQMAPLQQLKTQISQPRMAKGGLPAKYAEALPEGHKPEFITGLTGYYASGKGTGQSDDIDAMLHDGDYVADADLVAALGDGSSKAGAEALEKFRRQIPHQQHAEGGAAVAAKIADGEYVFPASFVTAIGGGDNKAGAKVLDKMREAIRAHKRSAPTTKIPPKAKSPLEYLKMAKG